MIEPRLTICHLLYSMFPAGAEVLTARIVRRLGTTHRFVFAFISEPGTLGEQFCAEGYPAIMLGKGEGVSLGVTRRLRAFLRAEAVDVVHAHDSGQFLYAAMARIPARRPAVLLMEHGRPFPDFPRRKRMAINRLLMRPDDRVVAVGKMVQRALIVNEGFPASRVEVVLNGIDLSAFRADGVDRDEVRRELGFGLDDFVLIQVARMSDIKDHRTALGAFESVRRRHPAARLVLVGDGPEAGPLRALARDRGLELDIRMLGVRSDVPRLLQGADLALLTSRSEGIPLSLVEGMATGLPVVATAVGGVPEVVLDGETGLLAPPGDALALADRILALATDPARRATLGRAGRARAQTVFSEDRMLTAYDQMYREMTSGSRPRRTGQPVVAAP